MAANTAAMMILLYLIYVIIVVNHAGVNNGVLGFSLNSMSKRSTSSYKLQSTSTSDSTVTVNDGITDNTTQTIIQHKRPRIPILSYQNNYVIVNKPTGMSMHHNSKSRWGRNGLVLEQSIKKQLARKPYLVHRLDHRTSGACLLGFDSTTASKLHGRLRSKDAMKLYVALVRGDLRHQFQYAAGSDGVDMSIDDDGSLIGRCERLPVIALNNGQSEIGMNTEDKAIGSEYKGKITVNIPIKVDNVAKEAQTDFYFLSSMDIEEEEDNEDENTATPYITKSLTLLLCRLHTGRSHQIRKHVRKAFNAPIIGDSEHGDSRVNRYWRQNIELDRMGLHCWYINLPPSDENESEIECMAPLPLDFSEVLHHEMLKPLWKEATRIQPLLKRKPYDERSGSYGRSYRKSLKQI